MSGGQRGGAVPGYCNSQTFMLISLKFTEQEAVLTLPFEHCGLESLDKILQEGF